VMATAAILTARPAVGLYHCVNTGAATWHDLAVEVRRQVGNEAVLEGIRQQDVTLAAARPRYCALSNDKLRRSGIVMPSWQDAVARALAERRTKR
jgi:dTDP-4-dehydrorhamnose reductase